MRLMKAPKAQLADWLYRCGLLDIRGFGEKNRLIVFNYHRIPPAAEFTTPFDEGVFGPPTAIFEEQIAWLKRNLRLLSEAELIDIIDSGKNPSEAGGLITSGNG